MVCLVFGELTRTKAIPELAEGVRLLSPEARRRLCVAIVGRVPSGQEAAIAAAVEVLDAAEPLQVVQELGYLAEGDVQPLLELADVVAVPYLREPGGSVVLVQAAAARRPVLAPRGGWMGETVERLGLGLTVDPNAPDEIAAALERFLREPRARLADEAGMRHVAEKNSAEEFGRIVFGRLAEAAVA